MPRVVAELGPGDSIGIGLAALTSGAEKYFAMDVVSYATLPRNLSIFEELVELFRRRENIPDATEFPQVKPTLESYKFPSHILADASLSAALTDSRLSRIRHSFEGIELDDTMIRYCVPWFGSDVLTPQTVNMVYSQAVLEHVDDLSLTYRAVNEWLADSGFMSHVVDFRCHGTSADWNGHWTHSDVRWRLIRGKRPWLLNREPFSTHLGLMEDAGFKMVASIKNTRPSAIQRENLAPRFRDITDDDMTTAGAFFQAVKK